MTPKEILSNENNFREAVQFLLFKVYEKEFKVIDGLSQHPEGMNFTDWLIDILEKA